MSSLKKARDYVLLYLNGERIEVRGSEVFLNLTDYLRIHRELTGTKVVCAEGDCGACTVLRAFPRPSAGKSKSDAVVFESINACVVRVAQMDGSSLVTVEALGKSYPSKMHPVQEAMIQCHGSQCGFCTPGVVGSLAAYFETHSSCDSQKIKNALTGNLCRCTGYQPILDAALSVDPAQIQKLGAIFASQSICEDLKSVHSQSLLVAFQERVYFAPANVDDLNYGSKKYRENTVLAAGSDLGVAYNKGRLDPQIFFSLHLLSPLYQLECRPSGKIRVGARVSLTDLRKALKSRAPEVAAFFDIFASPQIKNFATLAGNIANASPIADTPPLLFALNAQLDLYSPATQTHRKIPFANFNLAYKKTELKKGELIWAIEMELPKATEKVSFSKAAQRRDLDISCANTGFWFKPGKRDPLIPAGLRLGVGGVGPIPMRLRQTEDYLLKNGIRPESIREAVKTAQGEISPISDLRGTEEYRRVLIGKFLEKFLVQIHAENSKGRL